MRCPLMVQLVLAALSGPLLLALPAMAQSPMEPDPIPPIDFVEGPKVTGQMIVDSFRPPPGTLGEAINRAQASGYLRATKDLLPAKWCYHPRLPQHEVDGEIIGYIAALPPAARQGDAARLIADALAAKFPCSKRKER